MKKIGQFLNDVVTWLVAFGAFGLFAIALIDSALIPLPGGADAVMMILSAARPVRMPLYAFAAALGSTIGCLILYYFSQRAGARALHRFTPEKQARVQNLIERWDILAVLVASLFPPPFPFKLFVITAGVFRFPILRFACAIFAGRLFRFLLWGFFAIKYGEQAKSILARNYPLIGVGVAALLITVFVTKNLLRNRSRKSAAGS